MIVRYLERARDHLREIGDYTSRDDPAAAERTLDRIAAAVARLEELPRSARRGRRPGTYELIISGLPYITVYRVGAKHVDILGVFHAARHSSARSRS